ncbi:MAG: L-myo-inositol-1-phosphate synthase [Nitrososphaerota archaeon]|nr:L-myo-inositol-1-phosphate synthase [Nitrososphaerota archaeon]
MPSKKIKIALVGVGNVSSTLVQGLNAKKPAGIWHQRVGGFAPDEAEIVAAYDIDKRKVGKDLSEAIFETPNVSPKLVDVNPSKIVVLSGITKPDVPRHLAGDYTSAPTIVESLKQSGAEILVNLIPSGMQATSVAYAKEALEAGVSFINATPAKIATDPALRQKFAKRKLLVVGDDLMSQFGGTAFHKGILNFIDSRGIRVEKSYQLDVGGGNETLNTISEEVKMAKRDIKTESIAEEIPYKFATVAGTTDYVDYMGNNRTSYFWLSGKGFLDSPIKVDIYLRTNDGANAVNVLLDVIRAAGYCRSRKIYGSPKEICDYGFKLLPKPVLLHQAHKDFYAKFVK